MLIDRRHKTWIVATLLLAGVAMGMYAWLGRNVPGGLTGGSTVGLWYGILGSLLMVFAGLLSALRHIPSWWWIGSRTFWLKGHIWLGLLSGVVLLCHSGYHWGGGLTQALWIAFGLTILTGVYGVILQNIVPRLMTLRFSSEAPQEQLPHLCDVLRRKADALDEAIWSVEMQVPQSDLMGSQFGMGAKVQLQQFYEKHVRPFLSVKGTRNAPLLAKAFQAEQAFARLRALPALAGVKEMLEQMEALCDERRQLAEQERLHHWLHGWLVVHIPLSVVLFLLTAAHVVVALYY
jgi:hypothetical protein